MKRIALYVSILFFVYPISVFGQVMQEWIRRYYGPGNPSIDQAFALAVANSGNIYVTGYSSVNGTDDFTTIKYNSSGIQQWIATYDGPAGRSDVAFGIVVDSSENVYVSGHSMGIGTGSDITVVKYNSSGIQQWVVRYHSSSNLNDAAHYNSIAVDGLRNVYVTGWTELIGDYDYDWVTIKYDSSGIQQWVRNFTGDGGIDKVDMPRAIKVDNSGNVYVTGSAMFEYISNQDYVTIKYDSAGTQQWIARFDGPIGNVGDDANDITVDDSGNVYVTGGCNFRGSYATFDIGTIKYNSSGIQQWAVVYNSPLDLGDFASSILLDGANNVIVGGTSESDFCLIKYSNSGSQEWLSTYNGTGNSEDAITSMALDNLSNIYVTGYSTGYSLDYTTVKYNPMGIQQWVIRYEGANVSNVPYDIAVDNLYNVYVTGMSFFPDAYHDFATIKYSQRVGISTEINQISTKPNLYQNIPNPFNLLTKIRFALPKSSFVNLVVFDVLGSEVAVLVNEELKAGTYETDWDADGLTSGVYFYKLQVGDFTQTKKMTLIR